ncbi:MAG TPA: hypothetical protein HPP77_05660 [Candidatus Hydrogenedentes bacterium]|nr:hypothetical protein [Candidatus Hydrogenedentota bacterium]HIJ73471.1 hypothetical protein [Candidatus Hydrogenedentota bacterium]
MRLSGVIVAVMAGVVLCACPAQKSESPANRNDAPDIASQLIGRWYSVDFVRNIEDFQPGVQSWRGDLFLKEFEFAPNGKTHKPFWTWSEAGVYHSGDKTTAKFVVKTIGNEEYLFLEWITGDVTIRGQKPSYYVLKKES